MKPIIDDKTTVMILETFPDKFSLKRKEYYADKGNDFWKLISDNIGQDITNLSYDLKIKKLLSKKIGLWNIYHDPSKENDFTKFKEQYPNVKVICLNGKKAVEFKEFFINLGYKTRCLPSSCSANRRYAEERSMLWNRI